ncbi:27918_t:CDS:1 [Dentiscutata erythropus]|uniref:27918_t:CDS:1 n=1 Tax=Dentiscutata erythropus TaxID=1348616 RepID=A0A9N9AG59_9GLOM|nr:27918_t:CDS:1 [Dentiscutata erythropus]
MIKIEDMLRVIYANDDIIQELKLIPINCRKSTSWRVLKSVNSKKGPNIEIMKMEDLLRNAYINNGIIIRELDFHLNSSGKYKEKFLSIIKKFKKVNTSTKFKGISVKELSQLPKENKHRNSLLPLKKERNISKNTKSISEQGKSITNVVAYSPPSVFKHDRRTTAINTCSLSILERDESKITAYPLPSKQKENSIVDDALILRQSGYISQDQNSIPVVQIETSVHLQMQIKRNSANLTTKIYCISSYH